MCWVSPNKPPQLTWLNLYRSDRRWPLWVLTPNPFLSGTCFRLSLYLQYASVYHVFQPGNCLCMGGFYHCFFSCAVFFFVQWRWFFIVISQIQVDVVFAAAVWNSSHTNKTFFFKVRDVRAAVSSHIKDVRLTLLFCTSGCQIWCSIGHTVANVVETMAFRVQWSLVC